MRIVQISDFHFTRLTCNPLRLCAKRLIGMANWLINRKISFHEETLAPLPELFQQLKADLVLIGGDLTTTSLPSEFEIAQHFVSQIKEKKLLIPGNHDNYTESSYRLKRFYQYFANPRKTIEHAVDFFTLREHGIEAHRLGDWGWCVALDTAPATSIASSNGIFSEKLETYLEEALDLLKNEKILLLNHFPFFQNDLPQHRLRRADALQKAIEKRPNVCLYLHGHTHRHCIADLQSNNLPVILDSGCPVQTNGTWNLIDLKPDGCTVQPWRWQDTWTPGETQSFTWKRS